MIKPIYKKAVRGEESDSYNPCLNFVEVIKDLGLEIQEVTAKNRLTNFLLSRKGGPEKAHHWETFLVWKDALATLVHRETNGTALTVNFGTIKVSAVCGCCKNGLNQIDTDLVCRLVDQNDIRYISARKADRFSSHFPTIANLFVEDFHIGERLTGRM